MPSEASEPPDAAQPDFNHGRFDELRHALFDWSIRGKTYFKSVESARRYVGATRRAIQAAITFLGQHRLEEHGYPLVGAELKDPQGPMDAGSHVDPIPEAVSASLHRLRELCDANKGRPHEVFRSFEIPRSVERQGSKSETPQARLRNLAEDLEHLVDSASPKMKQAAAVLAEAATLGAFDGATYAGLRIALRGMPADIGKNPTEALSAWRRAAKWLRDPSTQIPVRVDPLPEACANAGPDEIMGCHAPANIRTFARLLRHQVERWEAPARDATEQANERERESSPEEWLPASVFKDKFSIPPDRLDKAARDGRLDRRRSGRFWLYPLSQLRTLWPEDFTEAL